MGIAASGPISHAGLQDESSFADDQLTRRARYIMATECLAGWKGPAGYDNLQVLLGYFRGYSRGLNWAV